MYKKPITLNTIVGLILRPTARRIRIITISVSIGENDQKGLYS
jgi:hypothetical protein